MSFLLDTVTFLRLSFGSPSLSESARTACEDADAELYLSAVSTWEIAVKHHLGRLELPTRLPDQFVVEARERLAIESLPLVEGATLQLPKLPPLHRDPFDRMLICQAIEHGMTLVTPDEMVRSYPVRTLW